MARINRVNQEIIQWQEHEKQLNALFPGQIRTGKEALKNSLSFYNGILDKYKLTDDAQERRSLVLLKAQVKEIEQKIYPSLINRLFYKAAEILSPRVRQETLEVLNFKNEGRIKEQITAAGFGEVGVRLPKGLELNANSFSMPLSWMINGDKRINFELNFERNNLDEFNFTKYTAALQEGADSKKHLKQTFDVTDGFTPSQAYNLLSGRAVDKEYISASNQYYSAWKQLDFNDRDQSGNYKITTVKNDRGFSIASEIETLVEKGLIVAPMTKTIIDGIRNGNDQFMLMKVNDVEKVVYARADPINQTLKYFNETHEPVTLANVLGKDPGKVMSIANDQDLKIDRSQGLKM